MDDIRTSSLYEHDEYTWIERQIAFLRAGRFDAIDHDNLIDLLESSARRVRKEIRNRFTTLLMHMLKFEVRPEKATRSWVQTIVQQQAQIADEMDDSPGVIKDMPRLYEAAFPRAVVLAVAETGLPRDAFPAINPWSMDQAMTFQAPDPAELNASLRP